MGPLVVEEAAMESTAVQGVEPVAPAEVTGVGGAGMAVVVEVSLGEKVVRGAQECFQQSVFARAPSSQLSFGCTHRSSCPWA